MENSEAWAWREGRDVVGTDTGGQHLPSSSPVVLHCPAKVGP